MFREHTQAVEFANDSVNINTLTGVSAEPVTGISTSSGRLITRESDAVLYSGFGYTGSASRITARIHISRLGRVQDRQIQLWNGSELIGANLANLAAQDVQLYVFEGSFTVTESFGIVVDVGPHTQYPSSNTVYIRSVALQFE